jgi:hypothetical protein
MRIDEFEWDEHNEAHVAQRGFTPVHLSAVLEGDYLVLRNKRAASGEYRVIGRDLGGRLVTVVISSTHFPGRWRPVTAWRSNTMEERHARRNDI